MLEGDNYGFEEQFDNQDDTMGEEPDQDVDTTEPEPEPDEEQGTENDTTLEEEQEVDDNETSEETTNEETTEDEYEEVEIPEWIEDEFVPPTEFKTQKEKNAWYEENYPKLLAKISGQEFIENLTQAYEQELIQRDKNVEGLRAMDAMMKGQPELALKLYAPQYLAQKGHSPLITDDEAADMVDSALKDKFGEDYLDYYDKSKAGVKGTQSYMMFQKQQEILHHIEEQRKQGQEFVEQYQPPDPVKIQEYLDETYRVSFAQSGFSKEEFNNFVSEARTYSASMPLEDVYFVLNKEQYLKDEYQKGFEEGKKATAKNLNKVVNTPNFKTNDNQPRRTSAKVNDGVMKFSNKYEKIRGFN